MFKMWVQLAANGAWMLEATLLAQRGPWPGLAQWVLQDAQGGGPARGAHGALAGKEQPGACGGAGSDARPQAAARGQSPNACRQTKGAKRFTSQGRPTEQEQTDWAIYKKGGLCDRVWVEPMTANHGWLSAASTAAAVEMCLVCVEWERLKQEMPWRYAPSDSNSGFSNVEEK